MTEPTLRTRYDFTLPRGYVDHNGRLQKTGTMRLATARDELEPLRDPSVSGPDDPRLTIVVLARVVEKLGDLELVTTHEIEGLFAVDLAFLQDFYGVINFGTQEEFEALLSAQQGTALLGSARSAPPAAPTTAAAGGGGAAGDGGVTDEDGAALPETTGRSLRSAVEELPRRAL
ncbi:hypothetical protein SAMN05892883_0558 [Jatrophihabitans sp. GAS493]|uniref:hypothetical protein n=1 Tax=Jatrophihabitans sp. GAS493 TaxID=1907575 RepID=UPI000BBFB91D|nr:hypothetical protein [Jatrophihabitans sp. GAS493]SOD70935.1 hypothetical protein SAMN05892883_0558 [Jatrophihabitans sp. GAS493]